MFRPVVAIIRSLSIDTLKLRGPVIGKPLHSGFPMTGPPCSPPFYLVFLSFGSLTSSAFDII